MMCAELLLVVAGGVPSFEGGYLEEERRRSAYLRLDSADAQYSPGTGDVDVTLWAVSGGYSHSFGGGRTGSCPAAFVDIAGQCSNVQIELLVQSVERDIAGTDAPSELVMLLARYAGRSPDGFAAFAEGGLGLLDTDETDTHLQLGVGAGHVAGVTEVRVMGYLIAFNETANLDYEVFLLEAVHMMQPSSENWILLEARWKWVNLDGGSSRDTETYSLSADWYFLREAHVGIEVSKANCKTNQPDYLAQPAGVLGKHIGCRIRGGYEGEDFSVSAWIEPRIREDSDELAWGFCGALKF